MVMYKIDRRGGGGSKNCSLGRTLNANIIMRGITISRLKIVFDLPPYKSYTRKVLPLLDQYVDLLGRIGL